MRTTLGELEASGMLEFGDGYRTKEAELASQGYRILRAGDVDSSGARFKGADFVNQSFETQIGAKRVRAGDVVLTTKGTVGRTGYVSFVPEPAVYSPQLCYFRVRPPHHRRFFYYWLSSPEFSVQRDSLKGSTDMAPYLSLGQLRNVAITLPDPGVQRAIAEVLGALDDKIAANAGYLETIEAHLRAVYRRDIAHINAEISTIESLFELNPPGRRVAGKAPYLPMHDLPSPGITLPQMEVIEPRGGVRFMRGDTLLARITPCLENGKTGYVGALDPGVVAFGSTEYVAMRSRPGLPLPLSYFVATDPTFREEAIRLMVGSSGRQRVNVKELGGIAIAVTRDADALARFGSLAERQVALANALQAESQTLAALRDRLLPGLMDGSIRVKDAEASVSEVV